MLLEHCQYTLNDDLSKLLLVHEPFALKLHHSGVN